MEWSCSRIATHKTQLNIYNKNIIDLPNASANNQIIPIAVFARPVVDLNFKGKQIAYHLSIEMKVNVNTDTVTETLCK